MCIYRRSLDGTSTNEEIPSCTASSKRRSLSETSQELMDTEDTKVEGSSAVSAKVPKLEIRSPILTSLQSGCISGYNSDSGDRIHKHARNSHSTSVHAGTRRARSSENLTGSSQIPTRMRPRLNSASPFSFSLATPKNLNSFKFLQDKSQEPNSVSGSSSRSKFGLRRSLNALDQLAVDEQTLNFTTNLMKDIEKLPVQETEC